MHVLLVPRASGQNYSIEAGLADDVMHFDHHGPHAKYPSPSNNPKVPRLGADDTVEITHIDADSLLGLARMAGIEMPRLDYDLIEAIDLGGSSASPELDDPSYLYMVGVNETAKALGFPRAGKAPIDVTDLVETMLAIPADEYIETGRSASSRSESTYRDTEVARRGDVGLWAIGSDDPLDPSRPYRDGVACVVVYRDHFKSISVYCDPKSPYQFGGETLAGIPFAGHPKACGSPRGEDFTLDEARAVFNDVADRVEGRHSASPRYVPL